MMMNTAFHMVTGCGKYERITPVLCSVLQWLPLIQFKIAFHAFNCIQAASPAYFQHVSIITENLSGQAGLCSAECGDLAVPRTAMELCK